MRVALINYHLDHAAKIRHRLGDTTEKIQDIKRPSGMRRILFAKQIVKLGLHEEKATAYLVDGLNHWALGERDNVIKDMKWPDQ